MTRQKFTWVVALSLACSALMTSHAQAQRRVFFGGGSRGGFGRGGATELLRRDDVREELGITEDQQKKLEEIGTNASSRMRELFPRLREAQGDEERRKIMQEYRDSITNDVKGVLDKNQYDRVQQLSIQQQGTRALSGDDLAKELKLSDSQKEKIQSTLEQFEGQRREVRFNRDLSDEDRDAKLTAISAERDKAVNAILSSTQRQQFEAKKGKPFEFTADGRSRQPAAAPAPASTSVAQAPLPSAIGPATVNADGSEVTDEVIVSFGVESRKAGEPVEQVQFNFQGAPWIDVLRMLASLSGLALEANRLPPGSFTYFDETIYTPDDARDIINGHLIGRGWILIKRDRFLVVRSLDEEIPPTEIPTISVKELASRGNNELVRVIIPLEDITADEAAADAENLIGTMGKIAPITKTNKLMVSDIASNLRRIVTLLTEIPDTNKAFSKFPLKHIAASDAENIVRDLFGLERRGAGNVSAAAGADSRSRFSRGSFQQSRGGFQASSQNAASADPNAKVQITVDERTNTLLVKAGPEDLKVVREAIDSIDVEPPEGFVPRSNEPYLEVYQLKSADPIEVTKTLNVLYPGTVINEDGRTRRIHIRATPDEHKEISATIRRLDGDGAGGLQVAVVPLGRMDSYTATAAIQSLFLADGVDAPTVQPHPTVNALLIRATQGQVEQITKLLADLDPSEGVNGTSTMRTIPLGGRDGREFMQMIERTWNRRNQRNPIRTVVPSAAGTIRDRRIPALNPRGGAQDSVPVESDSSTGSGEARSTPRPKASPVSRPVAPAHRTRKPRVPGSVSAGIGQNSNPVLVSLLQETAAGQDDQPSFGESVILDSEDQAEKATDPEATSGSDTVETGESESNNTADQGAETGEEKKPSNAPVFMTIDRGNILAYSDDPEVLNRLEDMIASLSAAMPPRTQWTVFYLQSADATEASSVLERIFPTSSVSSVSSGNEGLLGELTGGISSMGRGLLNMSGLEGITAGPTTLKIIPDVRSNSLFVAGPPYLVEEVEEVLQILDASELPEQLRERAPRYIEVKHADVADVADIIGDVYKEELTPPAQRQQQRGGQNPLAAMMGGGGGNSNSRAQRVKMTLGVDHRTSRLIVSCSEPLFLQVQAMVEDIDNSAKAARRTTRVVTLNNVNSSVIKQTLGQLMPRVRVSSSSTRGGSNGGGDRGGDRSSSQGQPQNADQFRQMMMQRALQGGGGSPFGGGRGTFGNRGSGSPFGGGSTRGFGGRGGSGRGVSPFGGRGR